MEEKYFSFYNNNGAAMVNHCPVCNLQFDPLEARMIEDTGQSHLVYIRCRYCLSAIVAVVITSPMGINSIGMITDLSADEVARFRRQAPISSDDVLQAHQYIHHRNILTDNFDYK